MIKKFFKENGKNIVLGFLCLWILMQFYTSCAHQRAMAEYQRDAENQLSNMIKNQKKGDREKNKQLKMLRISREALESKIHNLTIEIERKASEGENIKFEGIERFNMELLEKKKIINEYSKAILKIDNYKETNILHKKQISFQNNLILTLSREKAILAFSLEEEKKILSKCMKNYAGLKKLKKKRKFFSVVIGPTITTSGTLGIGLTVGIRIF